MKPASINEYSLILLTSGFPFGEGEPFIDNEFPHLNREFLKVIIISQNTQKEKSKLIPDEIPLYRYNPTTSLTGFFLMPLLILRNHSNCHRLWQDELSFRNKNGFRLTLATRIFLIRKIIKCLQLREYISSVLKMEGISEKVVIYSYWLNTGAHAAALIDSPGFTKIARAHGSDLYEEKSPSGFLPLLHYCSMHLDSIFFVSEDGQKYFSSKYTGAFARLIVSRLGVRTGQVKLSVKVEKERFIIVSCSNIIPLKRIDLIIKALALVKGAKKIYWVHYGDGNLRDEIVELASGTLNKKNNIEYEFRGQVPNDRIMKFYSETLVDLFINTSRTEGLPVSIMEAQLHGIPSIATDVGGVREVVTAGTGKLVSADITPAELASAIEEFMNLPPEDYLIIRETCRNHSLKNFDADTNYTDFILKLNSILASRQDGEK